MITTKVDVAVIGAGPAGLSSAISAKENGAKKVIILDRNNWLGGILPQCIHDGFGVEETGISMTGPEYAEMYIKKVKKLKIPTIEETMVLSVSKNCELTAVNKKGIYKIKAKSIIFATGCREKTRWSIMIPGSRPSGIFTAGIAQGFINLYNKLPGKNILILGSGDVGLIMARRLKFEGANILGIVEILPYPSGLPRNVVQCLDDYDIPIFLNHTITYIKGKNRLQSVTIAKVDKNKKIIKSSQRKIKCDTLLLSLGLIPENELGQNINIQIDEKTGGPIVNQNYETTIQNFYACGNCLQVYDTVDMLSEDAKKAGKNAAKKVKNKYKKQIKTKSVNGIRYIVPQIITNYGKINFSLRVEEPKDTGKIIISINGKQIFNKKLPWINPANMIKFSYNLPKNIFEKGQDLEVSLVD